MERVPCLLCAGTDLTKVCEKGQFGLPSHVVVCNACGFSFLTPRWTKERYDRFYREEYDRYYRPEVLSQNDDRHKFTPVGQIVERLKERGLLAPFGRVLDLGSGMGHALTYLRAHHEPAARYDAIEPSPVCRDHLLAEGFGYLGADVYGPWEEQARNAYGLVIMRHVLEHFHDPATVLRKAREVLRDDGLLYVAVPNAKDPTRPLGRSFFRVVHISYFTDRSLERLLFACGLEPVALVAGDARERHEVFAICRKGPVKHMPPDPHEAEEQLAIYARRKRSDLYQAPKAALIAMLRRLHLIR